ncbi:hypothetical protein BDZ89DRAFT_1140757 [Hymenopellis radicata]|nr:hypothetical protein BDZ89DRAFT_1140757 [Hymenopellis radicata]
MSEHNDAPSQGPSKIRIVQVSGAATPRALSPPAPQEPHKKTVRNPKLERLERMYQAADLRCKRLNEENQRLYEMIRGNDNLDEDVDMEGHDLKDLLIISQAELGAAHHQLETALQQIDGLEQSIVEYEINRESALEKQRRESDARNMDQENRMAVLKAEYHAALLEERNKLQAEHQRKSEAVTFAHSQELTSLKETHSREITALKKTLNDRKLEIDSLQNRLVASSSTGSLRAPRRRNRFSEVPISSALPVLPIQIQKAFSATTDSMDMDSHPQSSTTVPTSTPASSTSQTASSSTSVPTASSASQTASSSTSVPTSTPASTAPSTTSVPRGGEGSTE